MWIVDGRENPTTSSSRLLCGAGRRLCSCRLQAQLGLHCPPWLRTFHTFNSGFPGCCPLVFPPDSASLICPFNMMTCFNSLWRSGLQLLPRGVPFSPIFLTWRAGNAFIFTLYLEPLAPPGSHSPEGRLDSLSDGPSPRESHVSPRRSWGPFPVSPISSPAYTHWEPLMPALPGRSGTLSLLSHVPHQSPA